MAVNASYAVQMKGISKYFGAFCALNCVDLNVKKGTIHALLGENGAGKSTLMNVLYGLYQAEEGDIFINGQKALIKNPASAIKQGIGMVHQHFMLIKPFTVTQNIMLGMEKTNMLGMIDEKKISREIEELSQKYALYIDPAAKIEDISVGMQQRVEILKALYRGVDILILDEPTAVLTPQEITELIHIMRKLVDDGKTVIIITHKLDEIKISADSCTIIRRGRYIDTVDVAGASEAELAAKMVGREVNLHVSKTESTPGEVIFGIENLVVADARGTKKVRDLSLSVKRGEILGVAGIDGNGQKELVEAIMNMTRCESGKIKIGGVEIQNTTPIKTLSSKISAIPEDRHKHGLVLDFTVAENMVLGKYKSKPFSDKGVLNLAEISAYTKKMIGDYDIRPAGSEQNHVRGLSGGNQQKVIIAREVDGNPDLLIAVQPTRGLDVGAIEFVHKSLIEQREHGKAVLLISLELDEIIDVSDRIAIIYNGSIVDTIDAKNADANKIGLLMAGGNVK